jgi:hypothetical protein
MRAEWIRYVLLALAIVALILLASCRYYVVEDTNVTRLASTTKSYQYFT